ncbi:MAG: SEC-C metal-binding domain-containing protein [Elusimicrobiaceae bacterium]|nr:SEC-C metal-binding domain-containing protein [Elusimicrobiaceae bacterium]
MAWDIFKSFGKKKAEPKPAAPAAAETAVIAKEKNDRKKKSEFTEEQLEAELAKLPKPLRAQLDNPDIKKKIVALAKRMAQDGVDLKSMKQVKSWMGKHPEVARQQKDGAEPVKVETFRREEPKIGRNDDCPCGSGKKYKKCCGR